jgi:DNA-binding NtrC family response regulator
MRRNGTVEPSRPFVLVVDDEEAVRQLLAEVLAAAGYRVATAASVREALPYLDDPTLAAIVSDIRMPEESGLVLVAAARERRPRLAVVLMTGAAAFEERAEAEAIGVAVLDKPFTFAEVEAAVAAALAADG